MAELIPVRRYVDADNSCLFSSIAYLTDANYSEMSKYKYRQMIAETLLNDSSKYSDAFLGKNKFEYINDSLISKDRGSYKLINFYITCTRN